MCLLCNLSVYMLLQDYHCDEAHSNRVDFSCQYLLRVCVCVCLSGSENYTEISHLRECYCQHYCPYL